jgi:hypothetical protein
MPRCSFPEADINWSSNFSIRKRLSMRSCTTRTLHVSPAIAIPGYAAQVSVRAGSVIARLASLNRDCPRRTLVSGAADGSNEPKVPNAATLMNDRYSAVSLALPTHRF